MRILLFMGNGTVVESAGGAEKVLCNMANEMTQRGHSVTVMCNDLKQGMPFYPLSGEVNFVNLDGSGKKKTYPQIKKIYRELTRPLRRTFLYPLFPDPVQSQKIAELLSITQKTIGHVQPDIIVSFFMYDHYLVTKSVNHQCCPLIVMHHNSPDIDLLNSPSRDQIKSLQKCECLQLLLPSYEKTVNTALPHVKTVVIPNIVAPVNSQDLANPGKEKEEHLIVLMGRLDRRQKRQYLLIEAFSQLAKEYPQWQVYFYGGVYDKEYAEELKHLIRSHALESQVFLKGTTDKPLDVLRNCDIFAFPSLWEGFPLALTEAMSVGLPCVGFKTSLGVNELIVDGYNGFLAENDIADFAQKLKTLMDDPQLRYTMGRNGHEFVKQFEPKKIWDQWENLLLKTVERKKQNSNPQR